MMDPKEKISVGESIPKKFKPVSYLTEKFEGSLGYSHIFISWKDDFGLRWVAEARGSGIQIISNVEFKQKNKIINIYDYVCPRDRFIQAVEYIWRESHKSYGFKQIVGLAYMRITNWWYRKWGSKKQIGNPFRDGEFSQICCELGIRVVNIVKNIKLSENKIENFGLIETREFNIQYGERIPQERVDRINSK